MGVIQFRCDDELQARFEALAKSAGMKPSELGRAILEKTLPALSAEKPQEPEQDGEDRQYESPTERVYARLNPNEYAAMKARAKAMGMSPYTWIMRLIRAHLTQTPQLNFDEVQALREASRELSYVGRSLNRLADVMQTNGHAHQKMAVPVVAQANALIDVTRDRIKALLDGNLYRWMGKS